MTNMKIFRSIYDWVLAWSEKPSGPTVLGIVSFKLDKFIVVPELISVLIVIFISLSRHCFT